MDHVGASIPAPPEPNNSVQLTAYSARCAPAFGSSSRPLGAYLLLRNVKYPKANFIARPSVDKLCTLWRQVLTESFSHKE